MRAAAIFALGTYVLNVSEDGSSEMRTTIDQQVGSALLGLLSDGSSIVRKVRVVGGRRVGKRDRGRRCVLVG